MQGILIRLAGWVLASFIGRIFVGAGLAIGGHIIISDYVTYFLGLAQSQLGNLPMTGLLGLSGLDVALSVMISALMVRVYLAAISASVRVIRG